ncbi:MAG: sugar-phosphatase [Terrisporobacter sp.]
MKYKLIALDIDGTLINSYHQLTEVVKDSIAKAKNKGVKVVLCTGRPLKGVESFLEELNLKEEGDYAATFNGALVQDTFSKDPISHLTLNYNDLVDLYNLSVKVGSRSHFYDTKTLYTFNKDISDYTVLESNLTGAHLNVTSLSDVPNDIAMSKFMMIDHPEILDECVKKIPAEYYDKYTIVRSTPFFLEFLNPQANKGAGIGLLAHELGIKQDEIICVGDAGNDKHMIEYAGLGVAMGNATEDIKDLADYITLSNDDDGVAHVINKFILNER